MRKIISLFLLLSLFVIAQLPAAAEPVQQIPPPPNDPSALQPVIERIGPGLFRLGGISIDKNNHSISFPATFNQAQGPLEYLLVHSRGKVHESLFRTYVEPYTLQVACLLLGFEGTDQPLQFQGDPATPKGDPVEITVFYQDKATQPQNSTPEKWILLRQPEDTDGGIKIDRLKWVYTGSRIFDNIFAAQTGGSIAAIYHDPDALIDNATERGENDKVWFVNEKIVPPVGTPVTLVIKPVK